MMHAYGGFGSGFVPMPHSAAGGEGDGGGGEGGGGGGGEGGGGSAVRPVSQPLPQHVLKSTASFLNPILCIEPHGRVVQGQLGGHVSQEGSMQSLLQSAELGSEHSM